MFFRVEFRDDENLSCFNSPKKGRVGNKAGHVFCRRRSRSRLGIVRKHLLIVILCFLYTKVAMMEIATFSYIRNVITLKLVID